MEKDAIWAILTWMSLMAESGDFDPLGVMRGFWKEYGRVFY